MANVIDQLQIERDAHARAEREEFSRRQQAFDDVADRLAAGEDLDKDFVREVLAAAAKTPADLFNATSLRKGDRVKNQHLARFADMQAEAERVMTAANARLEQAKKKWEAETDFSRRVLAQAAFLKSFGYTSELVGFLEAQK